MKTFKDSDQTLEAFHLLDEQRYCKGAAMIHYGFLLAELFQLFRNELSSKDIVSMLPKDFPRELNPGYCYFLPHVEGTEIFSSLCILEIDHLLFRGYNFDNIISVSGEQTKNHHQSSPVTSLDSTPRSSWLANISRNEFSTPNGMNTTISSIASTPRKLIGSFEPIDARSLTSSHPTSDGPINPTIAPQSPTPPSLTPLPSNNQKITQMDSTAPSPSLGFLAIVQRPLEPAVATPTITSPLSLVNAPLPHNPLSTTSSVPAPVQNCLISKSPLPTSPRKSLTPRMRGHRSRFPSEPLSLILDKVAESDEVSWGRGLRKGIRTRISREDVFVLEGMLETLGWKICSSLERSDWWRKEKCYLPHWSPLIEHPEGSFLAGIDIFWCLDDCLKYLKLFANEEPSSRRKGRVHSLRINLLEDSPQEFIDSLLDEPDPDSQFFFVWDTLKSSGWSIQEVDSTLLSIPVKRIAIPYWTASVLSSDRLTLDSFSKLTLNRDYFFFLQDAISYLKVFGNKPTKTSKALPERDEKFPLLSFPTYDASGREDPVDIQERRLICRLAQSPNLLRDDLSFLESLGWTFSAVFGGRKYILSPWGVLKSATKLSDLQPDFDYFPNRRDAISFLLKTGSCRTPLSEVTHERNLSICSPSVASEDEDDEGEEEEDREEDDEDGKEIKSTEITPIKNQVDSEKLLRQTILSSGSNYLFPIIRDILEDLGWKFKTRMNANSLVSDIFFSPWGWKSLKKSPNQPLLHGREYFVDHNEVVTYVSKHYNTSCSDAALKKTFPRRSLAGSGAQLFPSEIVLKLDPSPHAPAPPHPAPPAPPPAPRPRPQEGSEKNVVVKRPGRPKAKPPVAEVARRLSKSPEPTQPKVGRRLSRSPEPTQPPKETKQQPTKENPEMVPNKKFKYTYTGNDLCPLLSGDGLEGQLKFALNTSADSYCFSRIRSILLALGWNFYHKYQGSYVNLAPWADPKNPLLTLGVDYFLNPRDICEYLTKHGHKAISGEPSRRRHSSSEAKKKIDRPIRKELKSKPSKDLKPKQRKVKLPRVSVDDVTLSQFQDMESQMDTRCSVEIRVLLEKAIRLRPRLNLTKFEQVWEVLSDNNWTSESSEEKEGKTFTRFTSEGMKTHSFESENEVIDFIRIQMISRGQDYQKLVDRATFCPLMSFADEEEDDSAEFPETIEEELEDDDEDGSGSESEDFNDMSEMNLSSPLLDAITSYVMNNGNNDDDNDDEDEDEEDTPVAHAASTNELKRKSLSDNDNHETVGNGGAAFLQELDAEMETKRVRREEVVDEREPEEAEEVKEEEEGEELEEGEVYEEEELPQSLLAAIETAKQNLVPSHIPTFPLGREQEYKEILQSLDHMTQSSSGSLRVSGLHGQGKTITTQIALERYRESHPDFKIVWISASTVSSLQDVIKALALGTPSNLSGHGIQQFLHQSNNRILLVIDEIDILQPRIRDLLLSVANTMNSKLLLIGLENRVNSGAFQHSISFAAYDEASLSRILDSLTKNLFEEKSLNLLSKIFATRGDVRPMKVLALKCLEVAEAKLTIADVDSPLRPIVDIKIVNLCRKDVNPSMTSVLVSLHKTSLHILVSLVCSYRPGQLFSLKDMQLAINTFYSKRRMSEIGEDTMVLYAEILLQDGLLSVEREKKRYSSLNQYLQEPEVPYFSIGYEPDYLLDSLTESDIGEMALKELIDAANDRNPPSPSPFK